MARISGNSETKVFIPEVRLISSTSNPVGTLCSLWIGSRFKYDLDPRNIQKLWRNPEGNKYLEEAGILCECYPEYTGESGDDFCNVIYNVVRMVLKSNLPPLDAINYTFVINDANVAFREQLVRSRLPQNFWMQTSRTAELSKIDVNMLESIQNAGENAVDIYKNAVNSIRTAYQELVELGVPSEDIRLIPQGMLHRIYWMVPYRTLKQVVSTRLSWIAQASLWSPIINGVLREIRNNCTILFNDLGTPSDVKIKNGKIISHKYDNENEDRYYNRDPQSCDPLWLAYNNMCLPEHTNLDHYDQMKKIYINKWNDDILEIIDWDRSNPDRIGKFDRPYSYFKEHHMLDKIEGLSHDK